MADNLGYQFVVDTKAANRAVDELGKNAERVQGLFEGGAVFGVTVKSSGLDEARAAIETLSDKDVKIGIDVDVPAAIEKLKLEDQQVTIGVEIEGDDLDQLLKDTGVARSVELDVDVVDDDYEAWQKVWDELDDRDVKLGIDVDKGKLDDALDQASQFSNLDISVQLDAEGIADLSDQFSSAQQSASSFADTTKSALAELIRSGKAGSAEYDQLVDQIKKAAQETAGFEKAAKEAEQIFADEMKIHLDDDEARTKIERLADLVRATLGAEALGSIGEGLTGFAEEGKEAAAAMKQLSNQTGITGQELEALKAQAQDAFNVGVGESLADATKAMATAKQALGNFVSDADLSGVVQQAQGVATTFDKDINEVLQKSRPFISQFKLEGKEAFDLISLGMQKAGSAGDDFLDTIDEYSDKIAAAGISGQEFVGILNNGIEAGFRNTDQLADSIKETGIRLRAGDITKALEDIEGATAAQIRGIVKAGEEGKLQTADVLRLSAQQIQKAMDAGEITDAMREQLQVAVSGTLGEEVGGQLYTKIFSAPIDTDAVSAAAKIAGDQLAGSITPKTAFQELERKFDGLKEKAAATFGPIADAAGKSLTSIAQIGPGVLAASDKIKDLGGLSGVFGKLGSAAGGLGGSIKSMGSSIGALATGPAGIIAGIAAALFLAYQNSESFRAAVDQLLAVVGQALSPIMEQLGGILTQLMGALSPLLGAIGDLVGRLLTALMPVIQVIVDVVGVLFGALGNLVGQVLEALLPVITFLADGLSLVIGVVSDLVGWLVDGLLSVLSDVASFVQDVFLAVWDGLVAAFNFVVDSVSTVINVYIDFYKWIGKGIATVTEFVANLFGLSDAFSAVTGFVSDAIDALGGFITDIGTAIGLMDDAEKKAKQVRHATSQEIQTGVTSLRDSITGLFAGGKDAAEAAGEKIPEAVGRGASSGTKKVKKQVKEAVVDLYDTALSATRAAEDTLAKIRIDGIEDDLERLREGNKEKIRLLQRGIADEVSAIDEKISSLEAKKKEGYKTEIKFEQEARAALLEKQKAFEASAQADLLKQLDGYYSKRLDASRAATAALFDEETRRLQLLQSLTDRTTLLGLANSVSIETELIDRELERQVQTIAESLPAFKEEYDKIKELLVSEAIDEAEANRRVGQLRREVIASELAKDDSLIQLLTRQSNEKRKDIVLEGIREERRIEEEELRASNVAYAGLLKAQENLFSRLYGEIDDARTKDLEAELGTIEEKRDALLDAFNDGRLAASELYDQMRELGDRELEIQEEIKDGYRDILDLIREGAASTFDLFGQDMVDRAQQAFGDIDSLLFKTDTEIKALGLSGVDVGEKVVDVAYNSAAAITALTAAQALEGENIFKAFARNTLDIALQLLVANSKVIIAEIFGKSVAANPLAGTAIAIGLIGAFSVLTSLAKSALSSAEFLHGGFTGTGNPRDEAGIVHKEEFVFPAHQTRRHRRTFELIYSGLDPLTAAIEAGEGYWNHFGSLDLRTPKMQEFIAHVVTTFGEHHGSSREVVAELKELRKENEGLREALEETNTNLAKVAKRFSSKTAIQHEFGEMVLDGEKLRAAVNRSLEKEMSVR